MDTFAIVQWVVYALLTGFFLLAMYMWLPTLGLYRWRVKVIIAVMARVLWRTRYILFFFAGLYLAGMGVYVIVAHDWWWLGLVSLAGSGLCLIGNCHPPVVLLLGGSKADTYMLKGFTVDFAIRPLASVVLLAAPPRHEPQFSEALDNFRTWQGEAWRGVVRRLLDFVPLVVLDLRTDSAAVAEEVEWIIEHALLHKTIFFLGDSTVPPSVHSVHPCRLMASEAKLHALLTFVTSSRAALEGFYTMATTSCDEVGPGGEMFRIETAHIVRGVVEMHGCRVDPGPGRTLAVYGVRFSRTAMSLRPEEFGALRVSPHSKEHSRPGRLLIAREDFQLRLGDGTLVPCSCLPVLSSQPPPPVRLAAAEGEDGWLMYLGCVQVLAAIQPDASPGVLIWGGKYVELAPVK